MQLTWRALYAAVALATAVPAHARAPNQTVEANGVTWQVWWNTKPDRRTAYGLLVTDHVRNTATGEEHDACVTFIPAKVEANCATGKPQD